MPAARPNRCRSRDSLNPIRCASPVVDTCGFSWSSFSATLTTGSEFVGRHKVCSAMLGRCAISPGRTTGRRPESAWQTTSTSSSPSSGPSINPTAPATPASYAVWNLGNAVMTKLGVWHPRCRRSRMTDVAVSSPRCMSSNRRSNGSLNAASTASREVPTGST
jgi:hypothetical protein